MTPRYILEGGIRPWEESVPASNSRFVTLSILVLSLGDLLPLLNKLLPGLGGRFVAWFRWHTLRRIVEGSAFQKRTLDAKLRADCGRFRNPVVRTDPNISSAIANVVLPISQFELDTLGDYRRELLIGTANTTMTSQSLLRLVGTDWEGSGIQALLGLLSEAEGLVCGRCYDYSANHITFQWFGQEADLQLTEKALIGLGVRKVASRNQVSELLRD